MSDILRIDAEDAEVIAEAKDAAAEYANAKSYPDVMSAQERLRSMGAGAIPALLAENARLKARLVVTPEKVEAALVAYYRSWPIAQVGYTEEGRRDMRAALLAAGMTEEALQ